MPYVQGSKKASTWIKLKRLGTYDAVVTGYKSGDGKYKGTIGALAISQYLDGKLIDVGFVSGMTDAMRASFARRLCYDKSLPPKKVVTVIPTRWFAIEFLSQEPEKATHKYRHGRFNQLRPDKALKDCLFDQK
jgi:ATP-dependent DNA ligase